LKHMGYAPEPLPTLYPTRLPPSADARRLEFAGNGEKDNVLWVNAKIFTQTEGAIHSDIIVVSV